MALFIEIINGYLKGTRTVVRDGLVIGRKGGDLTIRDSKLSGKHARLEARSDGSYWLVDLGSANGIKLVSSRVRTVRLEPGMQFILGRTPFIVGTSEDLGTSDGKADTDASVLTVTRTFWDHLRDIAANAATEAATQGSEIIKFSRDLRLVFIGGEQLGTEWVLGYGPRSVGSRSFELPLFDKSLPARCFEVTSGSSGVVFKNEASSQVLLNGRIVKSETLKNGDIISISSTRIKVCFDE
jgi:pSer/pThr/pTyr-binding forkhead associated (FHA) protein